MKAYTVLLALICLNVANVFLINLDIVAVPAVLQWNPSDIMSWFTLSKFTLADLATMGITGLGLGLAGIVALVLRQYTYAASLVLIWVATIMITPLNLFVNGIPLMISTIWEDDPYHIGALFQMFMSFIFFVFILETLIQRNVT